MQNYKVIASPQPGPQSAFVECPVSEIFYGGARGGGKTMAVLLKWAAHAAAYSQATGMIVRRERTHLVDMINEAHKIYGPIGAKWREQAKEYVMPNGAILRFAFLESDKDAESYQGWNNSFVGVEEITQFSDPAPINKLRATLRNGPNPQFVATGNPGGPGHHWVKARYIDPAPLGYKTILEDFTNPFTGEVTTKSRVFIPSKIKDNKFLGSEYVATLQQSGSPQLVKAWLEGDWNVIEGAYFPEFNERHIIQPFEIPAWWTRYRAFDWGSYRPFCNLWFAVSDGDNLSFPRGALIVYREYYGASAPNVGLKMTADEVADGILAREAPGEKITFSVGDPSMFKVDGGPSIAEKMALRGVIFQAADNSRVTGWNEVRRRLKGDELAKGIYDAPTLYIFSTCVNLIRTLPIAQHDEHKPEDIDSDSEDHCFAAGTLIKTPQGNIPIEKLPGSGKVWSMGAWRSYRSARMTRRNAPVVEMAFSDGSIVVCTPDHKFMNKSGKWIKAMDFTDSISYYSLCNQLSLQPQRKSSTASGIICAGSISREKEKGCTVLFGNFITAPYQGACTFITGIIIDVIMTLKTLKCLHRKSTLAANMAPNQPFGSPHILDLGLRRPKNGINHMRVESGIEGIIKNIKTNFMKKLAGLARFVGPVILPLGKGLIVFARISVSLRTAGRQVLMILKSFAGIAAWYLGLINTIKQKHVRQNVGLRCVSVRHFGVADVYCLTVPTTGCFSLANGATVSNCLDAARYGIMARYGVSDRPPDLGNQYLASNVFKARRKSTRI